MELLRVWPKSQNERGSLCGEEALGATFTRQGGMWVGVPRMRLPKLPCMGSHPQAGSPQRYLVHTWQPVTTSCLIFWVSQGP